MRNSLNLTLILLVGLLFLGMSRPSVSAIAEVEASGHSATKGAVEAPVTIIEYSDFQCPACRSAAFVVDEILEKYGNSVYLIYRPFPLGGHKHAMSAALGAECARGQGKFWEYHDKLFENQSLWGDNDLKIDLSSPSNTFTSYAMELNLDVDTFNQCMKNPATAKRINAAKAEGVALQVRRTPTFFLNGVRVVGGRSLKARYKEIIEKAIRE